MLLTRPKNKKTEGMKKEGQQSKKMLNENEEGLKEERYEDEREDGRESIEPVTHFNRDKQRDETS